ncbi:MAG TPA: hypothetical protein P5183_10365 [Smithellaceae bacterium]|nr:hypothetical protein [Smithellaceae bacterium]
MSLENSVMYPPLKLFGKQLKIHMVRKYHDQSLHRIVCLMPAPGELFAGQ